MTKCGNPSHFIHRPGGIFLIRTVFWHDALAGVGAIFIPK
jgi:hypothetical protein